MKKLKTELHLDGRGIFLNTLYNFNLVIIVGEIIESTDAGFGDVLNRSHEKLVIIDFYHPACAPCVAMEPILEELANEMDIVVARHDVSKEPEIPSRIKITSVPTLVFVRHGKPVEIKVGLIPKETLKEVIKEIEEV
ncbi:thiol reductase thioredoxin [Candidatus Bathyarchaeota archaeon ex4484_205]|nr:MAG: thiol reductase thioredoxin [Candidatus Bathyarchaeota archaeon ex4484_205]